MSNELPQSVPVFDCHVLLAKPSVAGAPWRARCAAAPQIESEGATERAALQALVTRFKFFLHEHRLRNEPIPWQQPELTPSPNEVERWIPVHL